MTKEQIAKLADDTSDAYSWDAYGEQQWRSLIKFLAASGFDMEEIEAIVRSKHTRWSRDAAGGYQGRAIDFAAYMVRGARHGINWQSEARMLVEQS